MANDNTTTTTRTERLAACDLVRTRFAGRAQLRREAEGSDIALARLEVRLGLALDTAIEEAEEAALSRKLREFAKDEPAPWVAGPWGARGRTRAREAIGYLLAPSREARTAWAVRRYATAERGVWRGVCEQTNVAEIVASAACREVDRKRAERAERRSGDPLATRTPGHAAREIARRRAAELIADADFREATHGHDTTIMAVERGSEGADSSTESVRPGEVGLPTSYARKGYFVTLSEHLWRVSTAILGAEVRALNDAAPQGVVYLSPTVRVRQGRGTALVTEQLTPRQALRALREAA